jgi:large conductance mechanosensitive channel
MKKLFGEFKKFITRGNVLDMAVGVIVGGAFTAIVNGLSNFILRPIINWILALIIGKDGFSAAVTFLSKVYVLDTNGQPVLNDLGEKIVDLPNSIYIDWGSFISAVINFLLIAFVLFMIVKTINKVNELSTEAAHLAQEKSRAAKYKKLLKKNEKRLKKGKPALEIPAELLPPQPVVEEPVEEVIPEPDPKEVLLTEIRDLLKEKKK